MFLYLAAPYTSPEPGVRRDRVWAATRIAAFLMTKGHTVFSPITHGHAVAEYLPPALAEDHEFWMRQCRPMLEVSDALIILPLEGWPKSAGINQERRWAEDLEIPEFFWSITSPRPMLTDHRGLIHEKQDHIL